MDRFLDVYSTDDFKEAKKNLFFFRNDEFNSFQNLFVKGLEVEYSGKLLDIFFNFGLVEKYKNQWKANYLINSYQDCFFVTDSFLLPKIDRVFPISQDESLFLASQIKVAKIDRVLDIGTGSGIYAIISATQQAKRVVGIDINPKAIAYATFNAKLNGVNQLIEFLNIDIRDTCIDETFSYIISNPAIIPAPESSGFYLHSDGGIKGTDMSLGILNSINKLLTMNGKINLLCTSFSINNELEIVEFIKKRFDHEKLSFSITELYVPSLNDLHRLFNNYRHLERFEQFMQVHCNIDTLRLHYLYLEANYDRNPTINIKDSKYVFDIETHNGSWEGRLKRLFLVYSKMAQLQTNQLV